MSKIKVKATIQNKDEKKIVETTAILNEDGLKYKEDPTTTVVWNDKDNILIRETKEIRLRYPFHLKKKTEGTLEIKEIDTEIKLPIKTKKIERNNHNIKVEFQIEENELLFCVEEIK